MELVIGVLFVISIGILFVGLNEVMFCECGLSGICL